MYSTNLVVSGDLDTSFWLNLTLSFAGVAIVEDCGKKINGILQLESSKKGESNIEMKMLLPGAFFKLILTLVKSNWIGC